MQYFLVDKQYQTKYNWHDPEWIVYQIILELTVPTSCKYIFTKNDLIRAMEKIQCKDIMPFYDSQPQDEKDKIKQYYIDILHVDENIFDDDEEYFYQNNLEIIANNIINEAVRMKLCMPKQ